MKKTAEVGCLFLAERVVRKLNVGYHAIDNLEFGEFDPPAVRLNGVYMS